MILGWNFHLKIINPLFVRIILTRRHKGKKHEDTKALRHEGRKLFINQNVSNWKTLPTF